MITEQYEGFKMESKAGNASSMLMINRDGAGKLPVALAGSYTSITQARKAIDNYLRSIKPRRSISEAL